MRNNTISLNTVFTSCTRKSQSYIWMDILSKRNQGNCQARRTSKLYFVNILSIGRVSHMLFEFFVSEKK